MRILKLFYDFLNIFGLIFGGSVFLGGNFWGVYFWEGPHFGKSIFGVTFLLEGCLISWISFLGGFYFLTQLEFYACTFWLVFGLRIALDLCFLACAWHSTCTSWLASWLAFGLHIALDLRLLTFVRLHLLTFVRLAFSLHIAPNLRFLACIWFSHCTQLALLGLHFALLGFCSGCALHSTWQVFTSKYKITYLACGTWRCGIFYIS